MQRPIGNLSRRSAGPRFRLTIEAGLAPEPTTYDRKSYVVARLYAPTFPLVEMQSDENENRLSRATTRVIRSYPRLDPVQLVVILHNSCSLLCRVTAFINSFVSIKNKNHSKAKRKMQSIFLFLFLFFPLPFEKL